MDLTISPSINITDIEHFGKRYNVYRGDRTELTSDRIDGGGVLIAVECQFNSERLILSERSGLEHVCVKISFDSCNIYVFAVYIRSVHETAKFLEFAEIVKLIPYNEHDIVIVCGDFNQPGVKWVKADDGEYYLPINVSTEGGIAVFDTMFDCGFQQLSNIVNPAGNVLDLVFTNRFYEMSLIESTRPLVKSDIWHKALEMEVTIDENEITSPQFSQIYAYNSADFDAMNSFFVGNHILSEINRIDDLENAFHIFGNVLHEAIDSFVPRITVQSGTDPPCRIQSQIKSNPKHFWRFVNDRRKRSDIPAIVEYNDVTANTDTSKAELFADFFENQYTRSDIIDLDELLDECGDVSFDFEITEADVLKALQSIDANKGAGPDGISPKVLKNCAHSLSKPLTALFSRSFQQGCVPDALKKSRIVPIYKADDLKLIRTIHSPIDAIIFRKAIDQLSDWCNENNLHLNLKKCYVMTYAKGANVVNYDYTIDNGHHTFERTKMQKDLGVIFDTKLTFTDHIDAIAASAHAAMGFIKRTLKN
ncbi:uncharacterized protein LOC116348086, partial [Contarinia nasturtii]|uniref:uncharacterized protein LOC116348086 n=1 Tax=Contarinia nasturtii TaxID=265458 RepID=UPI0012D39D78